METLNYQCSICEASFRYPKQLKEHLINHTDEKLLNCFCGKSFKRKQALNAHRRAVHLGVLPFVCHLCGRGFDRRTRYNLHQKTCQPANENNPITEQIQTEHNPLVNQADVKSSNNPTAFLPITQSESLIVNASLVRPSTTFQTPQTEQSNSYNHLYINITISPQLLGRCSTDLIEGYFNRPFATNARSTLKRKKSNNDTCSLCDQSTKDVASYSCYKCRQSTHLSCMLLPTTSGESICFEHMLCSDCLLQCCDSRSALTVAVQTFAVTSITLSTWFDIKTMPADGLCLFHCFVDHFTKYSSSESSAAAIIGVDELFRVIMHHISGMPLSECDDGLRNEIYTEAKKHSSSHSRSASKAWTTNLGDIMPLALADYTKTQIVVYSGNLREGLITVTKIPENNFSENRIHVLLIKGWVNAHYNLLVLK